MNKVLNVFNNIPLEDQYKGFRVMFWVDIVLATLLILFGSSTAGLVLFIVGLQLGILSNNKISEINQNRIENKIDKLVENK